MSIITVLADILQTFWMIFLILPVTTTVLSMLIKRKISVEKNSDFLDYAVVITAYKMIEHSYPLVESLLKQSYKKHQIYLVADNCGYFDKKFNDNRVTVLVPDKSLHSKVGSINYAIEKFQRKHDAIIIFDADNLAHPNFIMKINNYMTAGYKAVQGFRKAKNLNSSYAGLDALGEMFYNNADRKLLFKSGSSSTLAGSGMAFELKLYIEIMNDKNAYGGFDKILQGEIVKRNNVIAFAEEAIVYDEKVTQAEELKNQRTRWLHAYFRFLSYGFSCFTKGLFRLNFNQFYFGLNHMRPPLFILALLSIVFLVSSLFFSLQIAAIWMLLGTLFTLNFVYILKSSNADVKIWMGLLKIPWFIFSQILSLTKINRARKKFILTNHTQILSLDEVLRNKK